MSRHILLAVALLCSAPAFGQQQTKTAATTAQTRVVEASCGKCKFGMGGDDCALAVRFNGKAYLVDGTSIDNFGDAHASDGFCNSIRQARVSGQVVNGRFKAS
ncbi:MAG: hypothetical protein EOP49_25845, partial [Sphingobacteriales bacterium]